MSGVYQESNQTSMTYRVTFLHKTDYCNLRPDDTECHYTREVEAKDKQQAIWQCLVEKRTDIYLDNKVTPYYYLPQVWSVEEM